MNIKNLFTVVVIALVMTACATTNLIDYSQISVPQEGGYQFRQITYEDQIVWGPRVVNNSGNLQWFTGSMFDVSDDGGSIVYIGVTTAGEEVGNVYVRSTSGGRSSVQRTFGLSATGPVFSPTATQYLSAALFPDRRNQTFV
jgi:NADPH:quinone reductase-like Zn-dependent oxidoreductase